MASFAVEVIDGFTRDQYLAVALDEDNSRPDSGWWWATPLSTGRGASR